MQTVRTPKLFLKPVHPFIIFYDFRAEKLKVSRLLNYSYYMYIPDINNAMNLVCTMDSYTSNICFTMGRFNYWICNRGTRFSLVSS